MCVMCLPGDSLRACMRVSVCACACVCVWCAFRLVCMCVKCLSRDLKTLQGCLQA
jgi:hypothetical protein